jgi:hypothetical protein
MGCSSRDAVFKLVFSRDIPEADAVSETISLSIVHREPQHFWNFSTHSDCQRSNRRQSTEFLGASRGDPMTCKALNYKRKRPRHPCFALSLATFSLLLSRYPGCLTKTEVTLNRMCSTGTSRKLPAARVESRPLPGVLKATGPLPRMWRTIHVTSLGSGRVIELNARLATR